jgi:Flp pilus assembly protein TadD
LGFGSAAGPAASALQPAWPAAENQASRSQGWTPLDQAINRFLSHTHRFGTEKMMESVAGPIARLERMLRDGGLGIEELLSTDFHGASLEPARESSIRKDSAFNIRRSHWEAKQEAGLGGAEFSAALRRFLAPHAPLSLADIACVAISGSPHDHPMNAGTRLRFELAGTHRGRAKPGWQATGEWEVEWAQSTAGWRITAWQPLEMTIAECVEVVFTDVTTAALGADPSYQSHLLRDTNYWRGVLDKASDVDIFGNSGVSVGDVDGSGRDAIYMCQPKGLPNRLYRQREPGVFEDIARQAGVDVLDNTAMALFADILNRGHQDLILITESSPLLFLNDGHGHFTLKRDAFPPGTTQAALTGASMADYDRDGYLDLYVCAYGYVLGEGSTIPCPYYDAQNGPPNRLYHNQGDGTFIDVTTSTGLDRGNNRYSFACAWNDLDDDGWPDLVVVNDFGRNNFYRNLQNGKFEEVTDALAGYGSGMSASLADYNGDGAADLYVSNMWVPAGERITSDPEFHQRFQDASSGRVREFAMGNALYVNSQTGSQTMGGRSTPPQPVTAPFRMVPGAGGAERARWAWCSDGLDLENSGALDLYVVNGYLSSPEAGLAPLDAYLWEEVAALSPSTNVVGSEYGAAWAAISQLSHQGHSWNGNERNVFYLNLGDGNFEDASAVTGLDFREDGRAFAVFDFDGDGDADLVLHNRTGPQLRLLRNDLANSNRSIAFRLTGTKSNRDAIGARIEVETPRGRQVRYLGCGSGFLSQHSKELVFGLGPHEAAIQVRVRWPGGVLAEFSNLKSGHRYFLVEGEPTPREEPFSAPVVQRKEPEAERPDHRPRVEVMPARFSTNLVGPLSVPLPPALRGTRLLWLWDPAEKNAAGLQAFLRSHTKVPGRLVLWRDGAIPSSLASGLQSPPWRADERFRRLWTTLLAYLYDYLRQPVFPTGLLFDAEKIRQSGSMSQLVKVYWGGAESAEILNDIRVGVKTGQEALPFPGRAILCSFRRDFRTLGAGLLMAGLYAEAENYLAEAAKANPADAEALYNLAFAREQLGNIPQSILDARAALEARSHFPQAQNLLGVLLSQSGRQEEARQFFEQVTRDVPDSVEAWNNLGYLELMENNLSASQSALEKALALAPEYTEALNNFGFLRAQQGNLQEAETIFHRVLALDPENDKARNNLAVIYANEGKIEEAQQILQTLFKLHPEDQFTMLNLVRLDLSLGKNAEAKELLKGWLARHPEDASAQQVLDQIPPSKP